MTENLWLAEYNLLPMMEMEMEMTEEKNKFDLQSNWAPPYQLQHHPTKSVGVLIATPLDSFGSCIYVHVMGWWKFPLAERFFYISTSLLGEESTYTLGKGRISGLKT
jgi:hypothetical protein